MDKRKKEIIEKIASVQPRNYWNTSGKEREFMRSLQDPDTTAIPKKEFPHCKSCKKSEYKILKTYQQLCDIECQRCGLITMGVQGRITKEPENPWWIDSPEHGYCFWRWLQDKSTPDGKMEPMQQGEIAKLFGCSATKIHFIIKEAIQKIKAKGLDEVLVDYASSDPQNEAIRPDVSKYDSDSDD